MDLNDYRKEIDRIDDQLIALFAQRMETAEKIAEYKKANGLRVLDARREKEKMREILDKTPDDLREYVSSLYSLIFELSRSRQSCLLGARGDLPAKIAEAIEKTPHLFPQEAAVACQGVEGAYSHQAADQFFAQPEITFFDKFEDVFAAVEDGVVDYGVLPVENSTAGSVTQVYDLMRKHSFYITKATKVLVRHNLLTAAESTLDEVTDIYSHPQALSQCMALQEQYRDIRFHEYSNTAAAAKFVAQQHDPHLAAIASAKCAELYDMHTLRKDVQDVTGNATRFICISKIAGFSAQANKISLCLTVPHKPGALYHLLHKFALNSLNLCKLESRPYPGKKFEYLFYLDIEGKCSDFQVRWLLNDLNNQLGYFKFLGSYEEVE